jgi:hypothetical protein
MMAPQAQQPQQEKTKPIVINFTGGLNNRDTPLQLFLRGLGECQTFINVDTKYNGRLTPLKPFLSKITAEGAAVHSVIEANGKTYLGVSTALKYLDTDHTHNVTNSTITGTDLSFAHAGNWIYMCDGTAKYALHITTNTLCSWGQGPPTVAPTVAAGAGGANPSGTYACYYRHKITLPDGTIVRSDLSPVANVTVVTQKIEWSVLTQSTFVGATTIAVELFRTKAGWADIYYVATVTSPTTVYSDDITDVAVQAGVAFDEDGYYGPPATIDIVAYHPGCDRLFCSDGNNVYWSEAGLYHTFVYDYDASLYQNVNSVYLSGTSVTGIIMFDEQMYFGSQATWVRLRGTNPDYWSWESVSLAIKGPVLYRTIIATPWGAVYPGNDDHLWMFNGFETVRIAEQFVFPSAADASTSHASFDGRCIYLFYQNGTNPELVLDFFEFPKKPPKIIQSTRVARCSFYCKDSDTLWIGTTTGLLQSGPATSYSVAMSFHTPEIPVDQLVNVGNAGSFALLVNSQNIAVTVTPYYDGVVQTALSTFTTATLVWVVLPLPMNQVRTVSLLISVTATAAVEFREPIMVRGEQDADF